MKNQDTAQNTSQDKANYQNEAAGPKNSSADSNPYGAENLDQESDARSKDIIGKDIEKDLMENRPSRGFETDIDKPESTRDEDEAFETIQKDDDNPVNREFEIGQLGSEELQ
ncbi:hypothetical protein [Flavobacterium sp. DG2-3]|uniref:hypothetical protein n=1 Tax=Flavobacterium sp. DG2-3 TaxID=3068317 RepID=UPI00273D4593|nr:hypothetical protein [Flavobacterium sp. DG2-3]MDP5200268.1 hypothetical protein [Flavobacterium sp. DG2-3]